MRQYSLTRKMAFTLIEVVVAVAIFALGLTAALQLASSAGKRVDAAVKRWERQHLLSQAAEYFLIFGFKSGITEEFFPINEYKVACSLEEPEGMPDGVEIQLEKWYLKTVLIKLSDMHGNELDTLSFDKIVYEDDM